MTQPTTQPLTQPVTQPVTQSPLRLDGTAQGIAEDTARGSNRPRHLVIMAAGTGGHIMPGLAVAREMQERGWSVSWLGTSQGMENRLVPRTGLALDTIAFNGMRGHGLWHSLQGGVRLMAAFGRCLRLLRQRGADAVLGMGGYVCFPGGWAAALLRKPLMLVNADAALLLSNRALLPVAQKVAFGFEGAAAQAVSGGVVTGNPVRSEIEELPKPGERFELRTGPLKLLVVGGSLGAKILNETLPQALALMPVGARPEVIHQTGGAHLGSVTRAYEELGVRAELRAFIDDMPAQLAACDVIVCRAGAITVSELCAAGVASVLVPLIVSTTAHQRDNAQWLAGQQAALHLPQTELTPQRLADLLASLERGALLAMAQRARQLARPHAAQRVADQIEALVAA